MGKIYIKGVFHGWMEVTPKQATSYIDLIRAGITGIKDEDKNEYINRNRLKGITVEELLNDSVREVE